MTTILIIAAILVYALISGVVTKLVEGDPEDKDAPLALLVGMLWPIALAISPIAIIVYIGYWLTEKFQKKNNIIGKQ